MPKKVKNVLPNTYIPVLSKKVLSNVLMRLPRTSLVELAYLWPKLVNTQPHKDEGSTQVEYNQKVSNFAREARLSLSKWPKRRIVDSIVFQHWLKGLNLLQMAQVDCQLIVDRPNAYSWILSTVVDSKDNQVSISLDPKKFLDTLANDMSTLFLTNIYVCRHPNFPLMIVRVQVFDLQPTSFSQDSFKPHISSHKPHFLAIPLNSPHIIHTPGDDMIAKIVLQAVERSLPQKPSNLLKLVTSDQKPIRSLESMHILKGSSRFGNSLGAWTPYADGTVDMLPLNAVEKHKAFETQENYRLDEDEEMNTLKQTANLRFKGSADGKIKSDKPFDDNRPRRSRRIIHRDDDESDDEFVDTGTYEKDEYSSIAPIQFADFIIQEQLDGDSEENYSAIKLNLTGLDVFAGLHELSVLTTDKDKAVIDPSTVPSWLTGEEGQSCGIVRDGKFKVA